MKTILITATLVMSALLCACENDQMSYSTPSSNANTSAMASPTATPARGIPNRHDDSSFVTEAAQGGMAEVELGRLATQKALSSDVKSFGQRMVTDHSKANTELKQLATKKSVTLPTALNDAQNDDIAALSKLSGAEFDRQFMAIMVSDHDKVVTAFENEGQNGADPDIKAWASKTLPVLKEHQRMAHQIKDKLK